MSKLIDLTDRKYGRLTVLGQSDNKKGFWVCKCSCEDGTIKEIFGGSLRNGSTKSCGCLHRERTIAAIREKHHNNKYDLSGEYGICYTNNGHEFCFDKEDYETLKKYQWTLSKKGDVIGTGKVRAPRIIMSQYHDIDGLNIHFRNCNKLDLRKCNLMVVTVRESRALSRINPMEDPNDSEGVYRHMYGWKAFINHNNVTHRLGYFKKKEDAIKARKDAERKYFGKYFIY